MAINNKKMWLKPTTETSYWIYFTR